MICYDVDTALSKVPVNAVPLTDDTDFKSTEESVAYNASGMALKWHFKTPNGAWTVTDVTPTTSGTYDWAHQGHGMYSIEIPASGGASINNDTEGFGYFTGKITGVLPFRGPTLCFRAAALNDSLIETNTTGLLAPTTAGRTLVVDAAGLADANTVKLGPSGSGTAQTARDIGASVLISSGTGSGQLSVTSGVIAANVTQFGGSNGTFSGGRPEVNTTHAAGTAWGSGAITAASIAADAITAAKIADGAIDAATFASGAITASAIAADAIGASELAADAVAEIQSGLATASALSTVAGYIDTEVAAIKAKTDNLPASPAATSDIPTAATIADAVWDEAISGHLTGGTTGASLNGAGSAGDPWTTALPGAYSSGTAGYILGTNLNATVGSRSTYSGADTSGTTTLLSRLSATRAGYLDNLSGGAVALASSILDAAGIRSALGLSSANLDTQLDALPTAVENADALLGRNVAGGSSTGRTVKEALYFLRNKWTIAGGTLTVYATDDSTSAWTASITQTAGDPVSASDPA